MNQLNIQTGLFPGRFQPFTNSHLERIEMICRSYPEISLCILIGDMGELNQANFLTVSEREDMITEVLQNNHLTNRVFIRHLPGSDPEIWVPNILRIVHNIKYVFTDNPFVYQPLTQAGLQCIIHKRTGIDSSEIRTYPFDKWRSYVPKEVFEYINKNGLYERIRQLKSAEKYPFLKSDNSRDRTQ